MLLSQEKLNNSTFIGQTINSTILDCGATTTVYGKKWLDCFLETLSKKEKKIPTRVGTKTFKFGDGIKLKSLKTVILLCVVVKMNVKIISDVVDADIPLLLSEKAMKRHGHPSTLTMIQRKRLEKNQTVVYHVWSLQHSHIGTSTELG